MKKEKSRLTQINTENILKLVRQILWISAISILVIETIGNWVLWKTGSMNYNGSNMSHMLFKYLLVPTIFNFVILVGSKWLVKALHADIYRQRYIYFIALELILLDVTYSHYQFLSVFSVLYVPIIVAALFEDRKFHDFVTGISLLAAFPGMAARIANPNYGWSTLPEMFICYAGILVISVISVCITRYLAYRTRQMEEVIDDAERANRAKGDFLANMSHEIRTPMNAVVGMCELILREPDITPTVRDYCRDIQSSGRSLLAIINDILDFSKIESGKLELIEAEFNIASILNDVINMAVARKGEKRLEIIVHADGSIPRGLIGDEQRIRQIIINLLTNAVKYTQEGCVVVRVTKGEREDGRIDLTVSVEDTGIGIRPEDLEKLFSSFQQVDTRKNRSVEGTGLGLAIVKRLVDLMGGSVNAASEYGKGSRFWFTIPLHIEDSAPFVAVDGMENVHVGAYVDWGKYHSEKIITEYNEMVEEMRRDLHTDIRVYPTMEELQSAAEKEHFTHIFTGRQEYETAVDWFKGHSGGSEVVIMQDRMEAVELPEGLKCMYLPFYILSLRSVFTGDEVATNQRIGQDRYVNFIAPDARVLIVDDNEVNLKVAEGLMRPYQMQVRTATSAREAFALLEEQNIDLVFMDHMMPEIDGVEATKMLRARPEEYYQKLPIIALTANAVNGAKEMFLSSGLNDFMAKPMELSALDRVLKTWLPRELLQRMEEETAGKTGEPALVQEPIREMPETGGKLDEALGIRYTGDEEAYRAVLEVYVRNGAVKEPMIRGLYEKEAWSEYVIEVHALKSTSLSVGARELSERAKTLELAGKAGHYEVIRENHDEVMALYRDVLDEGRAYLGVQTRENEAHDKELTQISAERVRELAERIHQCCESFDVDGIAEVCGQAEGLVCGDQMLAPFFERVRQAAEDFEYEQADEAAKKLLEALKL